MGREASLPSKRAVGTNHGWHRASRPAVHDTAQTATPRRNNWRYSCRPAHPGRRASRRRSTAPHNDPAPPRESQSPVPGGAPPRSTESRLRCGRPVRTRRPTKARAWQTAAHPSFPWWWSGSASDIRRICTVATLSINQSIDQSINQWSHQSINDHINQSIKQSSNQSIGVWITPLKNFARIVFEKSNGGKWLKLTSAIPAKQDHLRLQNEQEITGIRSIGDFPRATAQKLIRLVDFLEHVPTVRILVGMVFLRQGKVGPSD